jgi:predicted DNA-binding protein with PD1-like motif
MNVLSNQVSDGLSSEQVKLESGHYGRVVVARIKPNEDLVGALEALCTTYGMQRAVVRGVLGSLVDGRLSYRAADGVRERIIKGPGVEILNVFGEVTAAASNSPTQLNAALSGTDGAVYAGRLVRGANLAFITIEATLQEWIAESA